MEHRPPTGPPPPPSAELLREVAAMRGVPLRSPSRTLLLVAGASAAWLLLVLRPFAVRGDLAWRSPAAWGASLGLWIVAALLALASALLPERAQVLPSARRAAWVSLLVCVGAPTLLLVLPPNGTGPWLQGLGDGGELRRGLGCLGIGAALAAGPLAATLAGLRGAAIPGASALGGAAGAFAGAVAGLGLQLICEVGGTLHRGAAHGGAVVVAASVGALVAARALDRPICARPR